MLYWEMALPTFHATTILAVRRDGKVAIGGDGQVSVGDTVMKNSAVKVSAASASIGRKMVS